MPYGIELTPENIAMLSINEIRKLSPYVIHRLDCKIIAKLTPSEQKDKNQVGALTPRQASYLRFEQIAAMASSNLLGYMSARTIYALPIDTFAEFNIEMVKALPANFIRHVSPMTLAHFPAELMPGLFLSAIPLKTFKSTTEIWPFWLCAITQDQYNSLSNAHKKWLKMDLKNGSKAYIEYIKGKN